ncbi:MAG TPA: hypothetical protein VGP19_01420 [Candidatus Acidoferrales bacterium]|nr:hypothetical protein [Candidatus Acidoferrales bacterium]
MTEDKTTGNVELGFSNRSTAYGHPAIQIGPPRQAHWLCQSGKACRGARLRFDLAEQKSQTLLRFTHADWQAETDDFAACATTSSERMFRIERTAEGKTPGPPFSRTGRAD